MRLGKPLYQDLTGPRKPTLEKNGVLHWPVLLLYAEAMSSDFIEDFAETDIFSSHLNVISFSLLFYCCIHLVNVVVSRIPNKLHVLAK
jgi:Cns1/TTC4 Wheel domain